MSKALKQLRAARMQIMLENPFFGSLLMCTPLVSKPDIPTAATDMRSIFYNPNFIESLSPDHVKFVLAHEVLHKSMAHGLRRQMRNAEMWNWACDYAINIVLKNAKFKILDGALIDESFDGRSSEYIYNVLQKDEEDGDQGGGDKGLGADLDEPALSSDERAELEQEIKQQVAQAITTARMAGKLSASLERAVSEILEPAVPWSDVLREYMTRISHDAESWSRRNRRIHHAFLPSRYNHVMGPIVIIGDTSGSITAKEFSRVAAEVQAVSDQLNPEHIRVVWADTKVTSEQVFECNEPLDLKPTGGGGTDMCVPLQHVEQYDPQVVILITDGYTPWPQNPPQYPLVVCCTTQAPVPIGDTIRV